MTALTLPTAARLLHNAAMVRITVTADSSGPDDRTVVLDIAGRVAAIDNPDGRPALIVFTDDGRGARLPIEPVAVPLAAVGGAS